MVKKGQMTSNDLWTQNDPTPDSSQPERALPLLSISTCVSLLKFYKKIPQKTLKIISNNNFWKIWKFSLFDFSAPYPTSASNFWFLKNDLFWPFWVEFRFKIRKFWAPNFIQKRIVQIFIMKSWPRDCDLKWPWLRFNPRTHNPFVAINMALH